MKNKTLIFDAHLDLAMNAMEWNRDLRWTVEEIRKSEEGMTDKPDRAKGTVSLPSMREGHVGVCVATQMAGNSLHAGIGSDLDGAFGKEQSPHDLDTIADLQKVPDMLSEIGYAKSDIQNIMSDNWIRFLKKSLPKH